MKWETMLLEEDCLKLIDQRKIPQEIEYFKARDYQQVIFAIREMVVRGAPAIGATAAHGVYLAAVEFKDLENEDFQKEMDRAMQELAESRPTAVNLTWGIRRMEKIVKESEILERGKLLEKLLKESRTIAREDVEINKELGRVGQKIIPPGAAVLSHCNTGALATVGFGTALGVIRAAHAAGKNIKVFVDETRPRLQGARLNAFELLEEGIPATLIVDSTAAVLMQKGEVDVIVVGADRIAANGDTANKIGTFMLSQLAKVFNIPFYIAAPISTIDFNLDGGEDIEIEERDPREITHWQEQPIAPEGINVFNPAFDVTPAENITGIITEKGIVQAPFKENLASIAPGGDKG